MTIENKPYFDKFDRTDKYSPERHIIPSKLLDEILVNKVGIVAGFDIYAVNGYMIRGRLDIDYTMGGNAGRYKYLGVNQIWIDMVLSPNDFAPTCLHEIIECTLMIKYGFDYDRAHNIANLFEWRMRNTMIENNVMLTDYYQAVAKVNEMINHILNVLFKDIPFLPDTSDDD